MSTPTPNSQIKIGLLFLIVITIIAIGAGIIASNDHGNVSIPMIAAGPIVLAAFLWFGRNSEESGVIVAAGIIAAMLLIGFGSI